MKLSGIGVDIIENSRIKKMIKNKDFLQRVFSNYEILNSKKKKKKIKFHFLQIDLLQRKPFQNL